MQLFKIMVGGHAVIINNLKEVLRLLHYMIKDSSREVLGYEYNLLYILLLDGHPCDSYHVALLFIRVNTVIRCLPLGFTCQHYVRHMRVHVEHTSAKKDDPSWSWMNTKQKRIHFHFCPLVQAIKEQN